MPNCCFNNSIKYSRSSSSYREFVQLANWIADRKVWANIHLISIFPSFLPLSVAIDWLTRTEYSTNQLSIPFTFRRWINDSGIAVAVWISTTIPTTRFQLRRCRLLLLGRNFICVPPEKSDSPPVLRPSDRNQLKAVEIEYFSIVQRQNQPLKQKPADVPNPSKRKPHLNFKQVDKDPADQPIRSPLGYWSLNILNPKSIWSFIRKSRSSSPLGGLINKKLWDCHSESTYTLQLLSYLPGPVLHSHGETIRDQSKCRSPRKWQLNSKLIAVTEHTKQLNDGWGSAGEKPKGIKWDCSVLFSRIGLSREFISTRHHLKILHQQRSRLLGNEKWRAAENKSHLRSILNLGETQTVTFSINLHPAVKETAANQWTDRTPPGAGDGELNKLTESLNPWISRVFAADRGCCCCQTHVLIFLKQDNSALILVRVPPSNDRPAAEMISKSPLVDLDKARQRIGQIREDPNLYYLTTYLSTSRSFGWTASRVSKNFVKFNLETYFSKSANLTDLCWVRTRATEWEGLLNK